MPESVLAAQTLAEQNAAAPDSGSAQAVRRPCMGTGPRPEDSAPPHTGGSHGDADQKLRAEVLHLRRAMQTRASIDQARGILMATFGLCPESAWSVLVTTSQNTNIKLHRLASDLVGTVEGVRLPKVVQDELATAVTATHTTTETPDPTPVSGPDG